MSGNVGALPKWARNEIERLEGALSFANARWAQFVEKQNSGSDTYVGSRQIESSMGEASTGYPLPTGETITFLAGPEDGLRDVEIRTRRGNDGVRRIEVRLVEAKHNESLGVLSSDATAFYLKVVDR